MFLLVFILAQTVESTYLEVNGICTSCKKSPERQIIVRENNQIVILIQIDASNFVEFDISEFEI